MGTVLKTGIKNNLHQGVSTPDKGIAPLGFWDQRTDLFHTPCVYGSVSLYGKLCDLDRKSNFEEVWNRNL